MQVAIAGIHTDAGKTHFAAAFCANLKYDYFKLVQAGTPQDRDLIAKFSKETRIFENGVFLQTPASPHLAMSLEKREFNGLEIKIPQSANLAIELAGGLFTPLDKDKTMIDFLAFKNFPVILVAKYYLGFINHTILSIEALRQKNIKILCLVIMGKKDEAQDNFIKNYTKINIINLDFFDEKSVKNAEFTKQMLPLLSE